MKASGWFSLWSPFWHWRSCPQFCLRPAGIESPTISEWMWVLYQCRDIGVFGDIRADVQCGYVGNCTYMYMGADVETLTVSPHRDRSGTIRQRILAHYLHEYSTSMLCSQDNGAAFAGLHLQAEIWTCIPF
jgi:hypothetical protein